jgi:hypothetical protein
MIAGRRLAGEESEATTIIELSSIASVAALLQWPNAGSDAAVRSEEPAVPSPERGNVRAIVLLDNQLLQVGILPSPRYGLTLGHVDRVTEMTDVTKSFAADS